MSYCSQPTFTCNICDKARSNDTNHWWIIIEEAESWANGDRTYIRIERWNDLRASSPKYKHACGEEHAQRLVARWLSTGMFDEPPMPVTPKNTVLR